MYPADLLASPGLLEPLRFRTRGGVTVTRRATALDPQGALDPVIDALDRRRGLLLSSGVEAPGRYRRHALGFTDPPLALTARGRTLRLDALNARGRVLLPAIAEALLGLEALAGLEEAPSRVTALVRKPQHPFPEEERSRQPSVFSVLRTVLELFAAPDDPLLGLYGAFAYDLAFQFEPIRLRLERPDDQRDLVLYLPDRLVALDPIAGLARLVEYEFATVAGSTEGLERAGRDHPYRPDTNTEAGCDHAPGAYQRVVETAKAAFRRGDLFEVVPGQTFAEPCADAPSAVFRRLRAANPAPYEAFVNLGRGEFLVAASPEMYVRVAGGRMGGRVETCPISGTVARGADALGDSSQILRLLTSAKDAAELTMCTDVDRNDKARVCEPGSVRVIGRRMIELYSRLIHTVDHVEGQLRPGLDALDAFLTHTWAVTVTGAPKRWAMQFLEDTEQSPRRWYGGAFGRLGFDGGMDTGLTLRTIRMAEGVAYVRAGATLLSDSDPDAEDAECRLKAAAFRDAIRGVTEGVACALPAAPNGGRGRRVLLVDHDDSFVHTLADYLRQTGASVTTLRHSHARAALAERRPDLVVLSPGPGRPADFDVAGTIDAALALGLPVFGVCLGLQGMVERFGGALDVLPEPVHGKATEVRVLGGALFAGLPERMRVGRYHSLVARRDRLPADLTVTAETADGLVMAVEHRRLPLAAVQFHPESILSLDGGAGLALLGNVMDRLAAGALTDAAA
ncbi:anthranilate synthase [Azospirillum argentinense]|uniref:Anthranilate synthase n=1 Tax=Azospirillum argentinense TaxID=2970906 RepID=A0A060DMU8_9PROT|nr:anthranilate synthase [Azospirillum argentinense]AIB12164.1 anthranilate synthase [Azospirillum argentinense]EZQ09024.1 anthranilate synthase [Azospirillum argentinense]